MMNLSKKWKMLILVVKLNNNNSRIEYTSIFGTCTIKQK